jgi:hypothetical protein
MSDMSAPGPASAGPLGPEQKAALAKAGVGRRAVMQGPARVAAINGWSLTAFGGLSLLISLGSLSGMFVGAVILALGWNELQGRELWMKMHPAGAVRLIQNQYGLMAVAALYSAGNAWSATRRPAPSLTEMESLLDLPAGDLGSTLATGYLVVGAGAVLAFGITARYYRSRGERLAEYLRSTDEWIIELQRGIDA